MNQHERLCKEAFHLYCQLQACLFHTILSLQAEVVIQFFMGTLDVADTYCDDVRRVSYHYLMAPTGFWLDIITSLPWSINDLYSSQVHDPI
jgi:hypothetical protein